MRKCEREGELREGGLMEEDFREGRRNGGREGGRGTLGWGVGGGEEKGCFGRWISVVLLTASFCSCCICPLLIFIISPTRIKGVSSVSLYNTIAE